MSWTLLPSLRKSFSLSTASTTACIYTSSERKFFSQRLTPWIGRASQVFLAKQLTVGSTDLGQLHLSIEQTQTVKNVTSSNNFKEIRKYLGQIRFIVLT
jgi:hypothetical protein